ncbi:MAG TPA: OmpA family protein [Candidatus Sumerlaeota bacterium]|nr:OmpA family protein [Candidatus Sumerlaeota bacterium]
MTQRFLSVSSSRPLARAGRLAAATLLGVGLLFASGCQSSRALNEMSSSYDSFIRELIDKQKREATAHAEEVQRLRAENNDLKSRAETAERDLNRTKNQITEREQALADQATQSNQLKAEVERARGEVAQRDTNLQTLTGQAEEAKKQAEALEATRAQQAEELKKVQGSASEAGKKTKELEAKVAELTEALKKAQDDAGAKEKQVADLEGKMKTQTARADEAERAAKAKPAAPAGEGDGSDYKDALDKLKPVLEAWQKAGLGFAEVDPNRGLVVYLSADVLFEKGGTTLDPNISGTLNSMAEILGKYKNRYIEVQGHTDTAPVTNLPFADNWALASARADALTRFLTAKSAIESNRIKSTSCAQYRPVQSQSADAKKLTRRVEIVLSGRP